jgi:hypothetical protein
MLIRNGNSQEIMEHIYRLNPHYNASDFYTEKFKAMKSGLAKRTKNGLLCSVQGGRGASPNNVLYMIQLFQNSPPHVVIYGLRGPSSCYNFITIGTSY